MIIRSKGLLRKSINVQCFNLENRSIANKSIFLYNYVSLHHRRTATVSVKKVASLLMYVDLPASQAQNFSPFFLEARQTPPEQEMRSEGLLKESPRNP